MEATTQWGLCDHGLTVRHIDKSKLIPGFIIYIDVTLDLIKSLAQNYILTPHPSDRRILVVACMGLVCWSVLL